MNKDQITKLKNWLEILERRHELAMENNCPAAADHVISELVGVIKTLIALDINPSIINAQARLKAMAEKSAGRAA